ncbi:AAA family ATPase [Pseudomonas protegens]|uniref:McrB family protein n=1 Tax=Pseudomonas protegens TaxID=380021 RepID=UPI001C6999B6|nr:AAA family ATPase [Pseudomonas protegens]QYN02367.1 AAA family ATPase [Pseudomonas protegens]
MGLTTQELIESFEEAIEGLRNAVPRDSNKGALVKKWFQDNFNAKAQVSIVNEAKQAYNRAGEQINPKHNADHVVFVVTDPKAMAPLKTNSLKHVYDNLKTILFIEAFSVGQKFTPKLLMSSANGGGAVAQFFQSAYPALTVESFGSGSSSQAEIPAMLSPQVKKFESMIDDDDEVFITVQSLLADGYAGVIFTGYPGTGKSWYARQVGLKLVNGDASFVDFIQFHPGYQYEDFIESFAPNAQGGFDRVDKVFLKACSRAEANPEKPCVMVIDELSRTDVVRVFGEALTYLEQSNRGLEFQLSSGRTCSIPKNLIVLCTMNPWDRGIEELDLALERRFAKLSFEPDVERLKSHLVQTSLPEKVRDRLVQFFYLVSRNQNKLCNLGHAYFLKVYDVESLKRLWINQLSFHFQRVLKNDPDQLATIEAGWLRVFES